MPVCPQCDNRQFSSKEALLQHMRSSSAWHPFCTHCDRRFVSATAYDAHMAAKHPPTFDCAICDRTFHAPFALEDHYRGSNAHPNCTNCGKGFKDLAACDEHRHTEHPQETGSASGSGRSTTENSIDAMPSTSAAPDTTFDFSVLPSLPPPIQKAEPPLAGPASTNPMYHTGFTPLTPHNPFPRHLIVGEPSSSRQRIQSPDLRLEVGFTSSIMNATPPFSPTTLPPPSSKNIEQLWTSKENVQIPSSSRLVPSPPRIISPPRERIGSPPKPDFYSRLYPGSARAASQRQSLGPLPDAFLANGNKNGNEAENGSRMYRPIGLIGPATSTVSPPEPIFSHTMRNDSRATLFSETLSGMSKTEGPSPTWSFTTSNTSHRWGKAPALASSENTSNARSESRATLFSEIVSSTPKTEGTSLFSETMSNSSKTEIPSPPRGLQKLNVSPSPIHLDVQLQTHNSWMLRGSQNGANSTSPSLATISSPASGWSPLGNSVNETSQSEAETRPTTAASTPGRAPSDELTYTITPSSECPSQEPSPSKEYDISFTLNSPVGLPELPAMFPIPSTPLESNDDIPEALKPLPDSPVVSPVTVVMDIPALDEAEVEVEVEVGSKSLAPQNTDIDTISDHSPPPPLAATLLSRSSSADKSQTTPTPNPNPLHCRVCLADSCDDITASMCGHIFCNRCITDAVIKTNRCPVCMTPTLLYCLFRLDLAA